MGDGNEGEAAGRKATHVAIVLDRSGSMEACRDATIGGFNEYLQHVRRTAQEEELEVRLTLTVFNHEVRMPLFQEPLGRAHPLNRKTYVPDGMTAMLDAVGGTVDRLEHRGKGIDEASVLICVISDGYENASHRYSYADVAERIQQLTETGRWTFTYLGSNQDLSQVSAALHIPQGNTASYQATPSGSKAAWSRHGSATDRQLRSLAQEAPATVDFYLSE